MRLLTAAEHRARHLTGTPSKVTRDPAVRRFVDRLIPRHSFATIAAKARARFGPKRAPSKSSIHRYWRALRSRRRASIKKRGPR